MSDIIIKKKKERKSGEDNEEWLVLMTRDMILENPEVEDQQEESFKLLFNIICQIAIYCLDMKFHRNCFH